MKIKFIPVLFLSLFFGMTAASTIQAVTKNGFDLSRSTIPTDEIYFGGPPRDGIPSIDNPKFIPALEAAFLKDDDIVIGVEREGIARAYPTRVLVWHEIVNDVINGEAFTVTYCPLCGTGMVFERYINGSLKTFGVSGLLYQSDVLMYDRETETLWSQLAMKAVAGPLTGEPLKWLPSEHMTFSAWKEKHPEGEVLSTQTGFHRNYNTQPYASYFLSKRTMFPVPEFRKDLPEKDWVVGTIVDGIAKAYPVQDIATTKTITDKVGDKNIILQYDADKKYPLITGSDGETFPSVLVFWFAWQAFYPETLLWHPSKSNKKGNHQTGNQ